MKFQWNLILALIFALIVAIFAVFNVDSVRVNYIFGTADWPLILVILGSVLMGGLIVGFFGLVRIYILQRRVKYLQKENERLESNVENLSTQSIDVDERPEDLEEMSVEDNKVNKISGENN